MGVLRANVGGVWTDISTTGPQGDDGPQGPPGPAGTLTANSVSNTHLVDMAQTSVKGNSTGSTADPTDIDMATLKTMLGLPPHFYVQGTEPSSPVTGDVWIDTTP